MLLMERVSDVGGGYVATTIMAEGRGSADCRSWTDRQRKEFIAKFREQSVIVDELSNLKKDRSVYRQQPNSNIYFYAEKSKTLSECKKTLDDMKHIYKVLEDSSKTEEEH